jgi:hypothetical protein
MWAKIFKKPQKAQKKWANGQKWPQKWAEKFGRNLRKFGRKWAEFGDFGLILMIFAKFTDENLWKKDVLPTFPLFLYTIIKKK